MEVQLEALLSPGAAGAGSAVDHQHGLRTAWLAGRVARCLGLDAATVQEVEEAANSHDVGKRFVDDSVLSKPGRLDAGERQQVQMHVVFGSWTLLAGGTQRRRAAQVALLHHEWWNGMGYPFGLSRMAIPLAARITAVADVFDALSEERCYKPAWPLSDVVAYVAAQRGRQFDPRCADAMREVAARLPADWHRQALAAASLRGAEISSVPTFPPRDGLPHGMRTQCFV